MQTDSIMPPAAVANSFPLVPRKASAADLLQDIRAKMAVTTDPDRQAELLALGIDVLKRRQRERDATRDAERQRRRRAR